MFERNCGKEEVTSLVERMKKVLGRAIMHACILAYYSRTL